MVQQRLCTAPSPSVKFFSESFIFVQLDKGLAFFFLTFFSSPSFCCKHRFQRKDGIKEEQQSLPEHCFIWKWFYRVRQCLFSWVNNWTHATPHRILMFFMKWKKTQMRQTQSYQKKHALVLLQDSMSESVKPFHLKAHSPSPVRTRVFKCNVSHCLSSAFFTYLVSLLSVPCLFAVQHLLPTPN